MGAKKNKKKKSGASGGVDIATAGVVPSAQEAIEYCALREIAAAEKKKGNVEYLKRNFTAAVHHYTRGIAASAREPSLLVALLLNRGTTFLRLREYQCAVEDSTDAIYLESNNIKAHIILAFGNFFMQQYGAAFEAYDVAVKIQPQSSALQDALKKAQASLSAQHKKIKDAAIQSVKTGKKLRDTALEWLGDFGLLSIDEEPFPNPNSSTEFYSLSSSSDPLSPSSSSPSPSSKLPPNGTSVSSSSSSSSSILSSSSSYCQMLPLHSNTAISWMAPTSIKSELLGNDSENFLLGNFGEDSPPLVVVGDTFQNPQLEPCHLFMQSLAGMPAAERERLADLAKAEGNKAFQEHNWPVAISHYSRAVLLGGNAPKGLFVYYSNRAQAYIKLKRFSEAITDCTLSICTCPTAKAYMRRATARAAVGQTGLAVVDYRNALHLEPSLEIISDFERLLKRILDERGEEKEKDRKKEKEDLSVAEIHSELEQLSKLRLKRNASTLQS